MRCGSQHRLGYPAVPQDAEAACRTTAVWFSVRAVDDVTGTAALEAAVRGGHAPARPGGGPATARPGGGAARGPRGADERVCARPACRQPATATLGFSYAAREVELDALAQRRSPQTYDLCTVHAARTRPPHGWELRDRRPDDDRRRDVRGAVPADLGGDRTVAVLAAALRAVPDAVSEDAAAPAAEVTAPVHPSGPAGVSSTPAAAGRDGAGGAAGQSGGAAGDRADARSPWPVPATDRARPPVRRVR